MENPVALVLDEPAFRRAIRDEIESARVIDGRTAEARRDELPGGGKPWLTNNEAMAYLGLSRMTLQRYRDSGRLPYSKVGSNIYYRRTDIEALLEAGLREAGR